VDPNKERAFLAVSTLLGRGKRPLEWLKKALAPTLVLSTVLYVPLNSVLSTLCAEQDQEPIPLEEVSRLLLNTTERISRNSWTHPRASSHVTQKPDVNQIHSEGESSEADEGNLRTSVYDVGGPAILGLCKRCPEFAVTKS
jgi:hypothetical protein